MISTYIKSYPYISECCLNSVGWLEGVRDKGFSNYLGLLLLHWARYCTVLHYTALHCMRSALQRPVACSAAISLPCTELN